MEKITTTTAYIEVPVSERLPEKAGWYNLSCNGIPAACGRAYFNGEFFHFTKSSAVSGLLERGKEIYWHEKFDFLKAIGDAFEAGEKREYGIRKYNESDEPTKEQYINNLIEQP